MAFNNQLVTKAMIHLLTVSGSVFLVLMDFALFDFTEANSDFHTCVISAIGLGIMLVLYVVGVREAEHGRPGFGQFLTRLHGRHGIIAFILCVAIEVVRALVEDGPGEDQPWIVTFFIVAQLSFLALYATQEVCYDTSKLVVAHEIARCINCFIQHKKHKSDAALSSAVSVVMALFVMGCGFGRLLFAADEADEADETWSNLPVSLH